MTIVLRKCIMYSCLPWPNLYWACWLINRAVFYIFCADTSHLFVLLMMACKLRRKNQIFLFCFSGVREQSTKLQEPRLFFFFFLFLFFWRSRRNHQIQKLGLFLCDWTCCLEHKYFCVCFFRERNIQWRQRNAQNRGEDHVFGLRVQQLWLKLKPPNWILFIIWRLLYFSGDFFIFLETN